MSERCPKCQADEVDAATPRTVYACGSSDYDQRPGSFIETETCLRSQLLASEAECERLRREVEDQRRLEAWVYARRNRKAQLVLRYYYGEPGWVWEVMLQEQGAKSLLFEGQTSAHTSEPAAARRAAVEYLEKERKLPPQPQPSERVEYAADGQDDEGRP